MTRKRLLTKLALDELLFQLCSQELGRSPVWYINRSRLVLRIRRMKRLHS